MHSPSNFLFCLWLLILTGCNSSSSNKNSEKPTEKLDRRTEIRLQQYQVEGKRLYLTLCANCHQQNGQGLAQLYPPLAASDYLLADLPRAACAIKNGMEDQIVVNGVTYNQMMPGNPKLTNIEIAEILTYITNSWGNQEGLSPVKEVEKWLAECDNATP